MKTFSEFLIEMDKTQTSPGRDGDIDWTKKQIHLGPERMMKAKDVAKHALKALNKTAKKSHTKDVKEEAEQGVEEGLAEGSGPKEKQKTPYRDINSAEYRAAADKQKQQMAKDKLAEPGKKLLAKKGVAEETEQIDELSVNKMMKYSDAAEKDRARLNAKWDAGTASRKEQERVIGREEGENRAANKIKKKTGKYPWQLNKEEAEQLDEISQKLKQSYLDQSRDQVSQLKKHIKGEYSGIVKRMIARRKKGIALASK